MARPNPPIPTTLLPASGRKGRTPRWPLPLPPHQLRTETKAERAMWRALWKTPQAVIWERDHILLDKVAIYCQLQMLVNQGDKRKTLRKQVRAEANDLGLTEWSMARLHWKIVPDDEPAGPPDGNVLDIRDRLKTSG